MRTQEIFKALADPTRRQILKMLRKGSLTAGEVAEAFPITKGSLTHHFNALKAADLLRSHRDKQQIYYSLNTSVLEDAAAMILDLFQIKSQTPENSDEIPQ